MHKNTVLATEPCFPRISLLNIKQSLPTVLLSQWPTILLLEPVHLTLSHVSAVATYSSPAFIGSRCTYMTQFTHL